MAIGEVVGVDVASTGNDIGDGGYSIMGWDISSGREATDDLREEVRE